MNEAEARAARTRNGCLTIGWALVTMTCVIEATVRIGRWAGWLAFSLGFVVSLVVTWSRRVA